MGLGFKALEPKGKSGPWRALFLGALLLSLLFGGRAMGVSLKVTGAKKALRRAQPSPPVVQKAKGVKPVKPLEDFSDLSIERIYLKGCTIHVLIRNLGPRGLSERDYEQGKLVVQVKGKGTLKRHEFPLKEVDPKRTFLSRSGGKVDFDTKISCSGRLSVKAFFEGLKDGRRGRKHLSKNLSPSPLCKGIRSKALGSKIGPRKEITRSPIKSRVQLQGGRVLKSQQPFIISVTRVIGVDNGNVYIDRPLQIWWIAYGPELKIGETPIKIYLVDPENEQRRWLLLVKRYAIVSRNYEDYADINFHSAPWDNPPPVDKRYEVQVCAEIANEERCSATFPFGHIKLWLDDVQHLQGVSGNRIVQWPVQFEIKVHDYLNLQDRNWKWKVKVSLPWNEFEAYTFSISGGNTISIIWPGVFRCNGNPCLEPWETTEGEYSGPLTLKFVFQYETGEGRTGEITVSDVLFKEESATCEQAEALFQGLQEFVQQFRQQRDIQEESAYTDVEEWATVTHSDMAIEEVVPYLGDVRIKVVNHGPETCYGQFIPFKITLTDRYATRTFRKSFRLSSSIPVGGSRFVYLGRDLGICLWDSSFSMGVEFGSERDWIDENASNDSYWRHFDLPFDPRPNLYFHDSGRGKIRIKRRGDRVTIRVLPKFEGKRWCRRPYTVRFRLVRSSDARIFCHEDVQTEQGPVELVLSASDVRRQAGESHIAIEVFLDWWDDVKEANEGDNHEYVFYDF